MHWYTCKCLLNTLERAVEQLAGCLAKETKVSRRGQSTTARNAELVALSPYEYLIRWRKATWIAVNLASPYVLYLWSEWRAEDRLSFRFFSKAAGKPGFEATEDQKLTWSLILEPGKAWERSVNSAEMDTYLLMVLLLMALSYGVGSEPKQYCIVGAGPGGKLWTSASKDPTFSFGLAQSVLSVRLFSAWQASKIILG